MISSPAKKAFSKNNIVITFLKNIRDFEPFTCDPDPKPENCPGPSECQYTVDNEDIIGPIDYRLRICGLSCPRNFPWLGNPLGQ